MAGRVRDTAQCAHRTAYTVVSLEDVRGRRFDPTQGVSETQLRALVVAQAKRWRSRCQTTTGPGVVEGQAAWVDDFWAGGWSGMSDNDIGRVVERNVRVMSGKAFRAEVSEERFVLYTDENAGWGPSSYLRPDSMLADAGEW